MIEAEAHSDDRVFEATFDATPYFEQASDAALEALAACGFGGDEPADRVAIFMAEQNESVAAIFSYLEVYNRPRTRETIGFECHVDEEQALLWLKEHRAHLHERLATTTDREAGRKGVNVYSTPSGNKRLCIEDAAAEYGNDARLLGPSERGEQCEKCGAVSNGAGTSTFTSDDQEQA